MGLLAPSPGEVVDRQTILELKIAAAKKNQISTRDFAEEYDQLQAYLGKNSFTPKPGQDDFKTLYAKLKDMNTQLWNIEDEIRLIIRQAGAPSSLTAEQRAAVCRISFAIPRLNDQRAELVQQINKLFNINRVEKLYNSGADRTVGK